MTESLTGASYRKNSICAPPRRMKHPEQLPPPAGKGQLCAASGEAEGRKSSLGLCPECVSINCNSNFFLWKLTLNWKQHSFASSTQFLQANVAILAVSLLSPCTCTMQKWFWLTCLFFFLGSL